ncbi:MAG: hypothetical protein LRY30_01155 [Gammaproteobacteria bacterium]|nr:hypothetical protein [Gammaproteobacteria bacterium]
MLALLVFYGIVSCAEAADVRPYKISLIVFKHIPPDPPFSPRFIPRWATRSIEKTTLNEDSLLPPSESSLDGAYRALLSNTSYEVVFNGAWVSELTYGQAREFYLHGAMDEQAFWDIRMKVTRKYALDVDFQAQWLTPVAENRYSINDLNEHYTTPVNQIQYIDGPLYSALIKITRAYS